MITFAATVTGTVEGFDREAYGAALAAELGFTLDEITVAVASADGRRRRRSLGRDAMSPSDSSSDPGSSSHTAFRDNEAAFVFGEEANGAADTLYLTEDPQRRGLQGGLLKVTSRIMPDNPVQILAAEAALNAFTPESLSAVLGVEVAAFDPPRVALEADLAPSPPPPRVPPGAPPPPPPPPYSPPSPPPPPEAEGGFATTAAIGAAVGGIMLVGVGYANHRRKKRWGATSARDSDSEGKDKDTITQQTLKPLETPDEDSSLVPKWLKGKSKQALSPIDAGLSDRSLDSFPMPPSSTDRPTGAMDSNRSTGADGLHASEEDLAEANKIAHVLRKAQGGAPGSPAPFHSLAKELTSSSVKFTEDGSADADDDMDGRAKKKDSRWDKEKATASFKDPANKPMKSMWGDVARDLDVDEKTGLGEVTPEMIQNLAENQAKRIEQRRAEQATRIEARRKALAARQEARQEARQAIAADAGGAAPPATLTRQNSALKATSSKERPAPKQRVQRSHRAQDTDEMEHRERPGRVLRDGSVQPTVVRLPGAPPAALERNNSACVSTASKERPMAMSRSSVRSTSSLTSQKEMLEERRKELEAKKAARAATQAGSSACEAAPPSTLSRQNSAVKAAATKERPSSNRSDQSSRSPQPSPSEPPATLSRQNSALKATASKERPDSSRSVLSSASSSTALQREAVEDRRRELEAKKAARAAKAADGAAASPAMLVRQNSALKATSTKERPESNRRASSSEADALPARSPPATLQRENSALKATPSKERPISGRASATAATGEESSRSTTSSTDERREQIEERRRLLASRKAAREKKLLREQEGAPGSPSNNPGQSPPPAGRSLRRDNSALKATSSKERPESNRTLRSTALSPSDSAAAISPPAPLTRMNSALKAIATKERPDSSRAGGRPSSSSQSPPPLAPPATLMRENSALKATSTKERPDSNRAGRNPSPSTPAPPATLTRENSALMAPASKERPAQMMQSSARSAASSTASQREVLEERRRELEARKAARAAKTTGSLPPLAAGAAAPPAVLSRANSALKATSSKERPDSNSARPSGSPPVHRAPPQAPAPLRRENSAVKAGPSKERPEPSQSMRSAGYDAGVDPEVES